MAYNPSLFIAQNIPFAPSDIPLNAKSLFFDTVNFKFRPYVSIAEVNSYLNILTYRDATFDVIINTGGVLADGVITGGTNDAYWYKDGTADGNLVLKTNSVDLTAILNLIAALGSSLSDHITDTGNPHDVTKTQVGLSNVDNTSDEDKPISILQQLAFDGKLDNLYLNIFATVGGRTSILSNPAVNYIDNPGSDIIISGDIQANRITGVVTYLRGIWGGYDNEIQACLASNIFGSHHSLISGASTHATIIGGSLHILSGGDYNAIIGGTTNTVKQSYTAIIVALNCVADSSFTAIIASQNAVANASNTFITGSQDVSIVQGRNAMLCARTSNIILGTYNFMGPNLNGTINSTSGRCFMICGTGHTIETGSYSGIGAGQNHYIGSSYSYILGGLTNRIELGGTYNVILSGTGIKIQSVGYGLVGTGQANELYALYGTVLNGKSNIANNFDKATILGGESNVVSAAYGLVIQGLRALVATGASWGTVINGVDNTSGGVYSLIGGGTNNATNATGYGVVVMGTGNIVNAIRGAILNGTTNLIDLLANESTILNGGNNTTKGVRSIVLNGTSNTARSFCEIVGGSYSTAYTAASITGVSVLDRALAIGAGTLSTPFNAITLMKSGKLSLAGAGSDNPTAYLHLPAGSMGAGNGPLKFTVGGNTEVGTPEVGLMEPSTDGTRLKYTPVSGTRETLAYSSDINSITIDTTATAYTKATINAAYPAAKLGDTIICDTAGFTYIKKDNSATGNWSSYPSIQLT